MRFNQNRAVLILCVLLLTLAALSPVSAEEALPAFEPLPLGSFFPLEEPITLTAVTMNISSGPSVADSYVLDWIREKTNINLEIVGEFVGSEGAERLATMLVTESCLPDIFLCTRWDKPECAMYGANGFILPLEGYLSQCENWQRVQEICGPRFTADLTMPDGHIYCFGSVNECFHLTHQARMWVYQPWIDKLCDGVLPTTTEEFRDYLQKVAAMDPNGNGVADELPLTGQIVDGWATDPFTFLSNAFVQNNVIQGSTNATVAPGCYVDASGTVHCNWVEDAYREALRYMHSLYAEGLLDPQTYTQNGTQMDARLDAEPHLVGAVACGTVPNSNDLLYSQGNRWQDWTLLPPLEGPDGVRLSYQQNYDYFYNCNGLISRDCAYPEIAVRLFDLLFSTEGTLVQNHGMEHVNWDYCNADAGKALDGSAPVYTIYGMESIDPATVEYGYSSMYWPPDMQIAACTLGFRNAVLCDKEYFPEKLLWQWAEIYDQYSPGKDTCYPNAILSGATELGAAPPVHIITQYFMASAVNFITGAMNIETEWEAYLARLDSMGQQRLHHDLQAAYDEWRAILRTAQ